MKKRRRFRPGSPDGLEPRVVLSAVGRIAPVAIQPLDQSGRKAEATATTIALVNQAFGSFTQDYLQAQGAFFSMGRGRADQNLFRSYIRQRSNLLASELTRVLARVPGSLKEVSGPARDQSGRSPLLQVFLRARINGNNPSSLSGTLGSRQFLNWASQASMTADPNAPGVPTLVTYQALTAIETARTNTLNAVTFLVNKTFHN